MKSYTARQKEWMQFNGLKAGSTVKLLCKAQNHEDGWDNSWTFSMDKNIGEVGIIESIGTDDGISVSFDGSATFSYPYWVLKPSERTDIEVELNDRYTAIVKGDHIRVGCQSITFDTLDKLMLAVNQRRTHVSKQVKKVKKVKTTKKKK